MNQEQINRYSACIYRMTFMLQMIDNEVQYFSQFKSAPSGIRNEFNRLKTVYSKGIQNLTIFMPNSKETFKRQIEQSPEKISAMCVILEKLSLLDEETVFKLEDDFNKQVKIQY